MQPTVTRPIRLIAFVTLALLVWGITVTVSPAKAAAIPSTSKTLTSGGTARHYQLYRPSTIAATGARPLLIVLHPAGGTGAGFESSLNNTAQNFDSLAPKMGFQVAYPDSLTNFTGTRAWHAGCCDITSDNTDDVQFISDMIDAIPNVDKNRVYVFGFSAGAYMAYRLACDLSSRIAAFVSVAGTEADTTCVPTHPMSMMEIHGDQDAYDGYCTNTATCNPAMYRQWDRSVPEINRRWRVRDQCGAPTSKDYVSKGVTRTVSTSASCQGNPNWNVVLVTGHGTGHCLPDVNSCGNFAAQPYALSYMWGKTNQAGTVVDPGSNLLPPPGG